MQDVAVVAAGHADVTSAWWPRKTASLRIIRASNTCAAASVVGTTIHNINDFQPYVTPVHTPCLCQAPLG